MLLWDSAADDLIVRDSSAQTFTVPAVPLSREYLSAFSIPEGRLQLDGRFTRKIKWYLKPLVFGGCPAVDENVAWVDHSEHADLVQWWNKRYRETKGEQ